LEYNVLVTSLLQVLSGSYTAIRTCWEINWVSSRPHISLPGDSAITAWVKSCPDGTREKGEYEGLYGGGGSQKRCKERGRVSPETLAPGKSRKTFSRNNSGIDPGVFAGGSKKIQLGEKGCVIKFDVPPQGG